ARPLQTELAATAGSPNGGHVRGRRAHRRPAALAALRPDVVRRPAVGRRARTRDGLAGQAAAAGLADRVALVRRRGVAGAGTARVSRGDPLGAAPPRVLPRLPTDRGPGERPVGGRGSAVALATARWRDDAAGRVHSRRRG